MKIGINGQRLLRANPAGPEVYTANSITALAKVDTANKYVVYFESVPEGYFAKLVAGNPNFTFKVLKPFLSWTQVSLALELLKHPVEVLFTAVHTMPVLHTKSLKIVGMIHGLEYLSNTSKPGFVKSLLAIPVKYVARHADSLIVPSDYTKEALLEASWGISEQKITIIYEGVDARFARQTPQITDSVLEQYGLKGKDYLVAVSTIQPQEKLPRLIEAFAQLLPTFPNLKLVICGKNGWEFEETLAAPQRLDIADRVFFLGRVPDEDLPALLSEAHLFVSTSLEEGFGLPLLEAMACETYCVVSDIPPFRVLGQENVTYCDPTDVADIAAKIASALGTSDLTLQLTSAKLRAQAFTWEQAARKTLAVFTD